MEDQLPRLPWWHFVRRVARTHIRSNRELVSYVLRTTSLCVAIAVGVDVVNQLVFFEGWTAALRSWAVSAVLSGAIAAPISRAIGKAQLDLYRAKQVLERLSRTDPLTGLANRRALIEAADAPAPAALVLVIFDIDRFKRINDAHGHIAGDTVIQAVSAMMLEHLGPLGLLCRLGGEEFALLSDGDRTEEILDGVWSFRDHLAASPIMIGNVEVNITISAGVATREAGGSFNELYAEADRALYMAKASGRNRINLAENLAPARDRRKWRGEPERMPSGGSPAASRTVA